MTSTLHIVVAMKPLDGNFAQNAIKHGVAGLNIDACRTSVGEVIPGGGNGKANHGGQFGGEYNGERAIVKPHTNGRFPANVIHDGSEEVMKAFPQAGNGWKKNYGEEDYKGRQYGGGSFGGGGYKGGSTYCDSGSAARFFKQVKES